MQDNQTPSDKDTLLPCTKQKVQESAKTTWLITYASGSTDITHEILLSYSLECTECHTITWRESKYTLVHLTKRMRRGTLQKIMLKIRMDHNIMGSVIKGYETLASTVKGDSDSSMKEHPGFKQIVRQLNENKDELRSWMSNGDVMTNKSGILWNFIENRDPHTMSRAQLLQHVEKLTVLVSKLQNAPASHSISTNVAKPGRSIRSALFHYQHDKEMQKVMKKILKKETKLNAKEAYGDGSGEIYAAWNPLMKELLKLGFTCIDAETRVKALQTAGVLEPFELIRHAHVEDARLYEKAMHLFFKGVRVYKRKEFFAISIDDINTFFDLVEGKAPADDYDQAQWALALEKAKRRK